MSSKISLHNIVMRYGQHDAALAVDNISFSVKEQEFVCLLGPSGCGKTTLLHLIAGFFQATRGRIHFKGQEIRGPGVDRGFVFQKHGLFPWKTVRENVSIGPRMRGWETPRIRAAVDQYLEEMDLAEFSDAYPNHLSVGMQQRVGIARAFVNDPDVLLMDEPFASLDALTRIRMQQLLVKIWTENRKTVLFVTHDVEEAILLADRILILSPRPATIRHEIAVDLPRPRSHTALTNPAGAALKRRILGIILSPGENGNQVRANSYGPAAAAFDAYATAPAISQVRSR